MTKIQVKQKHIKAGKIGSTNSCPIALAFAEAGIPRRVGANVTYEMDSLHVGERPLPRSAKRFIASFDARRKVQPFTFIFKD